MMTLDIAVYFSTVICHISHTVSPSNWQLIKLWWCWWYLSKSFRNCNLWLFFTLPILSHDNEDWIFLVMMHFQIKHFHFPQGCLIVSWCGGHHHLQVISPPNFQLGTQSLEMWRRSFLQRCSFPNVLPVPLKGELPARCQKKLFLVEIHLKLVLVFHTPLFVMEMLNVASK